MHVLGFLNLILLLHVEKQMTSRSLIEDKKWILKTQNFDPKKQPNAKRYIFSKSKVWHSSKLNIFV